MKKQGKRSKKKHLSKEAFRKMRYKQNMWRVYKHTGKDEDYEVYKEALNAATNEVRKAKRNFEHKLAQNIKSDSKSFYAYVRSKQNVRDKVNICFIYNYYQKKQIHEYKNKFNIFTTHMRTIFGVDPSI